MSEHGDVHNGSEGTRSAKASRVALCLSGGGFRASVFHLGALRRLNELGVLDQVDVLSCVSGGSIVGAHLATLFARQGAISSSDWDQVVQEPFLDFVSRDIRTVPVLKRGLPWNWFRSQTSASAIAELYQKHLTRATLPELPARPEFIFNAAEMVFGVNWQSRRANVGHYRSGYAVPNPPWTVARAVAASACFPPVFPPLRVGLDASSFELPDDRPKAEPALVGKMSLTDGGVYDNLGIEPVWKDYGIVLVSDGGSPFPTSAQTGVLKRIKRYTTIIQNQVVALRKRWLIDKYRTNLLAGAYWSVSSATTSYNYGDQLFDQPGDYSKPLARDKIARIRTDLDAFSPGECGVLLNHGYRLADTAVRKHAPHLIKPDSISGALPRPDLAGDTAACVALRGSEKRRSFGRGRKRL